VTDEGSDFLPERVKIHISKKQQITIGNHSTRSNKGRAISTPPLFHIPAKSSAAVSTSMRL